ncbi:guanine deaminase [Fructilactobacillus vespulae]|uniref:guanine deaminase n=1 Tax=Fructilactobacillus vespulae TaxID=1249630 RepID=UPI0039B5E266
MTIKKVIKGSGYTAVNPDEVQFLENILVVINQAGKIERIVTPNEADYDDVLTAAPEVIELAPHQYLLPGFIDTHIHAPQWPNAGLALDRPLYQWLNDYTFPLEAKYQDLDFSRAVYDDLTKTLVSLGTTTAVYFGTIYPESNLVLAEMCDKNGQRSLIGQVSMDDPELNPEYYRDESAAASVAKAETFIKKLLAKNQEFTIPQTPVITPRFLPSCTLPALKGLGQLAKQYQLPIQSHCSESDWENNYALEKYGKRDTTVLAEAGLLNEHSIMAHGTLLNDEDFSKYQKAQASIAHCPISNVYFGDGILPVKRILQHQVNVGLGTDISGGYSPSLYDNMKQTILSSQQLQSGVDTRIATEKRGVANSRVSAKTAFYLATVGGAKATNLKIGEIKPGCFADLQVVEIKPKPYQPQSSDDNFESLIYNTNENNIKAVYVGGKQVK